MNENIFIQLYTYQDFFNTEQITATVDDILESFTWIIENPNLKLEMVLSKRNRQRIVSKENWHKLAQYLSDDKYESFSIVTNTGIDYQTIPDWEEFDFPPRFDVVFSKISLYGVLTSSIQIVIHRELFFDTNYLARQKLLEEFTERSFIRANGIYGYITNPDAMPYSILLNSSYHTLYSKNFYIEKAEILRQTVPGVFWANYLSTNHIKILGGLEKIVKDAPCYVTVPMSNDSKVCLKLTNDLKIISEASWNDLRVFLQPLLPK